jgi:glycosidase
MNGATAELPAPPQDFLGQPDLAKEQSCRLAGDTVPITGDMLDSAFYFPQYYTVVSGVLHDGGATAQIESLWNARQTDWGTVPAVGGIGVPPSKFPVNFLDNHDVGRFLFYEGFDVDLGDLAAGALTEAQFDEVRAAKLMNAFVFIFTEQGIPCVYYGDEQGFSGGNDPDNREIFWPTNYATTPTTDPTTGATYGTYVPWIQKLTTIRKTYKALTHGDQAVVWSTQHTAMEDDAGIFAFERAGGDAGSAYALVILNTNRDKASSPSDSGTTMKVTAAAGTELVDVLGAKPTSYTVASDQTLVIQVPALSAVILVPKSQLSGG